MKSRLLYRQFIERLIGANKPSDIGKLLDETVYNEDMHEGSLRMSGVGGIEEGLRLNLNSTFQKVLDVLEGEPERVVRLLLERWDVQNVKTVLRGKHVGADTEEIVGSFVPAGSMTEATLTSLAKEPDIRAAIDLMATWEIEFSKPLTQSFPAYATSQSLAVLELALDKHYYESTLFKLSNKSFEAAAARQLIYEQIEFSNIMILLRLVNEGTAEFAERFYTEGRDKLSFKLFKELASLNSIDSLIARLAETSLYNQLKQSFETYRSLNSLAALERSLEERLIRKTIRLFNADPLTIFVVIAYLWAKVNEVVNVRIILRAKEAGMPVPAIRDALVLV